MSLVCEKYKYLKSYTEKLKDFFALLLENKPLHARWLNTLAFLEHIGSRKIIKSQNSSLINKEVLMHISEETRHAAYFKNLACKLSPSHTKTFEEKYLLKGKMAEQYFQNLDHYAEKHLKADFSDSQGVFLNYLYTTYMIEERAVEVYTLYNTFLKQNGFSFNLDFVLKEEGGHLKEVTTRLKQKDSDFEKRSAHFFKYEAGEFDLLLQAWLKAV